MKDTNALIGEWLAEQRKTKGWSQQYVADHLGCTRTAVHYWESGKRTIYAVNLVDYCHLLNADIEELTKHLKNIGAL